MVGSKSVDYKDHIKRANTFKRWPFAEGTSVSANRMVEAGFYHPPRTILNNATCFSCKKNLADWEEEDDPISEHKRGTSECFFLSMRSLRNRMNSFTSQWPHPTQDYGPTPESLSLNGFVYRPEYGEDYCECFMCGVGLDGWEKDDVPSQEHSKRNKSCPCNVRLISDPACADIRAPVVQVTVVDTACVGALEPEPQPEIRAGSKLTGRSKSRTKGKKSRAKLTSARSRSKVLAKDSDKLLAVGIQDDLSETSARSTATESAYTAPTPSPAVMSVSETSAEASGEACENAPKKVSTVATKKVYPYTDTPGQSGKKRRKRRLTRSMSVRYAHMEMSAASPSGTTITEGMGDEPITSVVAKAQDAESGNSVDPHKQENMPEMRVGQTAEEVQIAENALNEDPSVDAQLHTKHTPSSVPARELQSNVPQSTQSSSLLLQKLNRDVEMPSELAKEMHPSPVKEHHTEVSVRVPKLTRARSVRSQRSALARAPSRSEVVPASDANILTEVCQPTAILDSGEGMQSGAKPFLKDGKSLEAEEGDTRSFLTSSENQHEKLEQDAKTSSVPIFAEVDNVGTDRDTVLGDQQQIAAEKPSPAQRQSVERMAGEAQHICLPNASLDGQLQNSSQQRSAKLSGEAPDEEAAAVDNHRSIAAGTHDAHSVPNATTTEVDDDPSSTQWNWMRGQHIEVGAHKNSMAIGKAKAPSRSRTMLRKSVSVTEPSRTDTTGGRHSAPALQWPEEDQSELNTRVPIRRAGQNISDGSASTISRRARTLSGIKADAAIRGATLGLGDTRLGKRVSCSYSQSPHPYADGSETSSGTRIQKALSEGRGKYRRGVGPNNSGDLQTKTFAQSDRHSTNTGDQGFLPAPVKRVRTPGSTRAIKMAMAGRPHTKRASLQNAMDKIRAMAPLSKVGRREQLGESDGESSVQRTLATGDRPIVQPMVEECPEVRDIDVEAFTDGQEISGQVGKQGEGENLSESVSGSPEVDSSGRKQRNVHRIKEYSRGRETETRKQTKSEVGSQELKRLSEHGVGVQELTPQREEALTKSRQNRSKKSCHKRSRSTGTDVDSDASSAAMKGGSNTRAKRQRPSRSTSLNRAVPKRTRSTRNNPDPISVQVPVAAPRNATEDSDVVSHSLHQDNTDDELYAKESREWVANDSTSAQETLSTEVTLSATGGTRRNRRTGSELAVGGANLATGTQPDSEKHSRKVAKAKNRPNPKPRARSTLSVSSLQPITAGLSQRHTSLSEGDAAVRTLVGVVSRDYRLESESTEDTDQGSEASEARADALPVAEKCEHADKQRKLDVQRGDQGIGSRVESLEVCERKNESTDIDDISGGQTRITTSDKSVEAIHARQGRTTSAHSRATISPNTRLSDGHNVSDLSVDSVGRDNPRGKRATSRPQRSRSSTKRSWWKCGSEEPTNNGTLALLTDTQQPNATIDAGVKLATKPRAKARPRRSGSRQQKGVAVGTAVGVSATEVAESGDARVGVAKPKSEGDVDPTILHKSSDGQTSDSIARSQALRVSGGPKAAMRPGARSKKTQAGDERRSAAAMHVSANIGDTERTLTLEEAAMLGISDSEDEAIVHSRGGARVGPMKVGNAQRTERYIVTADVSVDVALPGEAQADTNSRGLSEHRERDLKEECLLTDKKSTVAGPDNTREVRELVDRKHTEEPRKPLLPPPSGNGLEPPKVSQELDERGTKAQSPDVVPLPAHPPHTTEVPVQVSELTQRQAASTQSRSKLTARPRPKPRPRPKTIGVIESLGKQGQDNKLCEQINATRPKPIGVREDLSDQSREGKAGGQDITLRHEPEGVNEGSCDPSRERKADTSLSESHSLVPQHTRMSGAHSKDLGGIADPAMASTCMSGGSDVAESEVTSNAAENARVIEPVSAESMVSGVRNSQSMANRHEPKDTSPESQTAQHLHVRNDISRVGSHSEGEANCIGTLNKGTRVQASNTIPSDTVIRVQASKASVPGRRPAAFGTSAYRKQPIDSFSTKHALRFKSKMRGNGPDVKPHQRLEPTRSSTRIRTSVEGNPGKKRLRSGSGLNSSSDSLTVAHTQSNPLSSSAGTRSGGKPLTRARSHTQPLTRTRSHTRSQSHGLSETEGHPEGSGEMGRGSRSRAKRMRTSRSFGKVAASSGESMDTSLSDGSSVSNQAVGPVATEKGRGDLSGVGGQVSNTGSDKIVQEISTAGMDMNVSAGGRCREESGASDRGATSVYEPLTLEVASMEESDSRADVEVSGNGKRTKETAQHGTTHTDVVRKEPGIASRQMDTIHSQPENMATQSENIDTRLRIADTQPAMTKAQLELPNTPSGTSTISDNHGSTTIEQAGICEQELQKADQPPLSLSESRTRTSKSPSRMDKSCLNSKTPQVLSGTDTTASIEAQTLVTARYHDIPMATHPQVDAPPDTSVSLNANVDVPVRTEGTARACERRVDTGKENRATAKRIRTRLSDTFVCAISPGSQETSPGLQIDTSASVETFLKAQCDAWVQKIHERANRHIAVFQEEAARVRQSHFAA